MFYVARPIHVSNLHTKFGLISSNGLGGDSITDGWTDRQTDRRADGGDNNIPFAILKKRGDNYKKCTFVGTCIGLTDMKIVIEN